MRGRAHRDRRRAGGLWRWRRARALTVPAPLGQGYNRQHRGQPDDGSATAQGDSSPRKTVARRSTEFTPELSRPIHHIEPKIRALPAMAQKQADTAVAVVERRDGSVRGLRDAALLAVLSDGLLRVSEAAALEVADLEAEDANTLTIRRSKTDQEAEGAVQYIGEPTVARVRAWLDAAGIAAGPLFQRLDRAGPAGGSAPCPSGPSSSDAPPRPGSRAACPATRYGSEGRSPWPLPGPRSSRCRPPTDGNPPPCPAAMLGASLPCAIGTDRNQSAAGRTHTPQRSAGLPRGSKGAEHPSPAPAGDPRSVAPKGKLALTP